MSTSRIHLIAPAGSCARYVRQLDCSSVADLCARIRDWTGGHHAVTADESLIMAEEDENNAGRSDDLPRAADITSALRDSDCVAIVALRGGAWFTRILPHIDLRVLDHRSRPVTLFGFSELTTLVNLVAAHPMGRGLHDMGPAFLAYGLKHQALRQLPSGDDLEDRATAHWQQHLIPETHKWFSDVQSIITGRGTARPLRARVVQGDVPNESTACVLGGNLTVLSTIVGTEYERPLFANPPAPLWLFLEDYNDKLERFDRFLSHLTLARWWDRFTGLLLGNFHQGATDLTQRVLTVLRHHLPPRRTLPILSAPTLGHIWPMSPLPLLAPLTIRHDPSDPTVALDWC